MEIVGPEPLLDRERTARFIERHFGEQVEFLEELCDWGVQFMKRAFRTLDAREIPDVVLLPVLLRQVLVMFDATTELLKVGAVQAAKVSMRSLFESSLSIEWILGDKERRALQFYVSDLRRRLEGVELLVPGNEMNTRYMKSLEVEYPDLAESQKAEDLVAAACEDSEKIRERLRKPRFRSVNETFEELKIKRGGREPHWYSLNGPSSLADLAARLDRTAEYLILYREYSDVAHGLRSRGHIRIPEPGALYIEPIRSPEDLAPTFTLLASLTIRVMNGLIDEFRPGESEAFVKKYVESWRETFRNVPRIEVEMHEIPE